MAAAGAGGAGDAAAIRPSAVCELHRAEPGVAKTLQSPTAQGGVFDPGKRRGDRVPGGAAGRAEFRAAFPGAGAAVPGGRGGHRDPGGGDGGVAQTVEIAGERLDAQIVAPAAAAGAVSELRTGAVRARAAVGGEAARVTHPRDLQRDGFGDG